MLHIDQQLTWTKVRGSEAWALREFDGTGEEAAMTGGPCARVIS